MTVDEWERIVLRLNANYPGQQVEPPTALEWFGPLSGFPAAEVWDAIDVLRRASDYLPSLKAILAAIDTNWRERSAARRELEASRIRAARNAPHRGTVPPEVEQIRELLERSKRLPGTPDHLDPKVARERIEALADQLNERVDLAKTGQLT